MFRKFVKQNDIQQLKNNFNFGFEKQQSFEIG